jgi:hypothetical protein
LLLLLRAPADDGSGVGALVQPVGVRPVSSLVGSAADGWRLQASGGVSVRPVVLPDGTPGLRQTRAGGSVTARSWPAGGVPAWQPLSAAAVDVRCPESTVGFAALLSEPVCCRVSALSPGCHLAALCCCTPADVCVGGTVHPSGPVVA